MQRPFATTHARRRFTPSRIAAFAGAGLIEVALIAAMLSGIGAKIVKQIPKTLSVEIVQPEPPKPEPVPVPQPQMVEPSEPTVALPDINIERPAPHTITAIAVPKPVVAPPAPPAPVVAPPAPPAPIPETPLQSVAATHTTPPYPEMARRMGEHGSVQLHISVAASGEITDVTLAQSSGHADLDQAALEWVKSHWRYHAATKNGTAIASQTSAVVVFDLKNAG
jgi:protein TonB